MLDHLYAGLDSHVAPVIISMAIILFSGFFMTRLTKRLRLPTVTAYILAGMIIGPFVLDLIPESFISGSDFLSDIALAFISFSTGEFFRFDLLKKNGVKVVIITLIEAGIAASLVLAVCTLVLHLSFAFSIVLASLASAAAPASTMMTIRQTRAKGDFVNTLLQVIALNDIITLLLFSVAISVALVSINGSDISTVSVLKPILTNLFAFVLGGIFGFILKLLMPVKRSADNRLIISIAMLFTFCGICALMGISPLLGCMSMGTVYINFTDDSKLFNQLNYFSPPLLLLFYVRSGLALRLDVLTSGGSGITGVSLLTVGIVFFFVRIIGEYGGAYIGCVTARKSKEVRNYLGLALLPQAGVAIGLAALGSRAIGGDMGDALNTIVLTASILFELVGPACAKLSLYLSHSYTDNLEELVPEVKDDSRSELEKLIERIQVIQTELPEHTVNYDEEIFDQAAQEYSEHFTPVKHRQFSHK